VEGGCTEIYRVTTPRSYVALDAPRIVCVRHAPDADSVRAASRLSSMPVERSWSFS